MLVALCLTVCVLCAKIEFAPRSPSPVACLALSSSLVRVRMHPYTPAARRQRMSTFAELLRLNITNTTCCRAA